MEGMLLFPEFKKEVSLWDHIQRIELKQDRICVKNN
jgi:hypothetical protein